MQVSDPGCTEPRATHHARAQQRTEYRPVDEGSVCPLVEANDPDEPGTNGVTPHAAHAAIGEEDHRDQPRRTADEQRRPAGVHAGQDRHDREVGDDRPPPGSFAGGSCQRPSEVFAEGEHQVGQDAEGEQMHRERTATRQGIAPDQPDRDREGVADGRHDARGGRAER
jgi:hypothetical protein